MNYRSWMLSYENDVQYLKDRVHVSIFFSWFFRKKCMSIISFLLSNYPKTHYHYFKNIFTSFIFNQFTVHKHSSIKKNDFYSNVIIQWMCIYTSAFLKSFLGHINAKEKSVTFFKYESFKKLYSFNNSKSNLLVNLIMLPKEKKGINQVKSY